jgi:hypothetical protein
MLRDERLQKVVAEIDGAPDRERVRRDLSRNILPLSMPPIIVFYGATLRALFYYASGWADSRFDGKL